MNGYINYTMFMLTPLWDSDETDSVCTSFASFSSGTDTWKNYEGCAPTADNYCSFLPQHPYVNVTLRVQAQAGNQTSPWSQTQPFVGHIQSKNQLSINLMPPTIYQSCLSYKIYGYKAAIKGDCNILA